MSQSISEYKLESYRKLKTFNEKGNLWLTEDRVTGQRFVMRRLSVYSRNVYERLADIHYPNIAAVYDMFLCGEDFYVIEEYVDGVTLSEVTDREG